MTSHAINHLASPVLPTLAELLDMITADTGLSPRRRTDIASAIRKTSSWFDLSPSVIPATPSFLRGRFKRLSSGGLGVSKKRIQNVRSSINFAIRHFGLSGRRRYREHLSPPWKGLAEMVTGPYQKVPMTRFFYFLSSTGVDPGKVSDAHSKAFFEHLERTSMKDPRTSHQNMCRAWNRAVDEIEGWPQVRLSVPRYRKPWAFRWDAFPESFRTDVDKFFRRQSGEDLFAEGPPRPLAPRTIKTQRDHLRCAASALARTGVPIDEIVDLNFLCRPDNVEAALKFYLERKDGKPNKYLAQIAYTIRTVALYHAKLEQDERDRVVWLYKRVAANTEGQPDRDLALLRWFDDEANVLRFFAFPTEMMEAVDAIAKPNRNDALRYQWAMAVEFLTFAELRIENLATLHLEENLIWQDDALIVHVPGPDVKNRELVESEIPGPIATHVKRYIDHYQPLVTKDPSLWLFPGKSGSSKSASTLRQQLKKTTLEGVGIAFHPHIFRKIGPKIFLDRRPGQYDIVRRKLGHKTTKYTFSIYTGSETRAAIRHFDEVLLDLYDDAIAPKETDGKRRRSK